MKNASIRAVRTAIQTLVGLVGAIPTVGVVTDIRTIRDPFLLALWGALWAGLISFLHNVGEALTTR